MIWAHQARSTHFFTSFEYRNQDQDAVSYFQRALAERPDDLKLEKALEEARDLAQRY